MHRAEVKDGGGTPKPSNLARRYFSLPKCHIHPLFLCLLVFFSPAHHDEAGVVPVPPAEGRHADFRVLVVMENLTSTVGVSAQDEAGLKPPQQLRRDKPTQLHHF